MGNIKICKKRMAARDFQNNHPNYFEKFHATVFLVFCVLAAMHPLQYGVNAQERAPCVEKITLSELRAKVLSGSPLTAAIDRRYAYELASALEKEVLLNPELQAEHTYTGMRLGGADDPQAQVSLGMPIRLSDFGSRDRVAALMRKAAEAQKGADLLELLTRLKVSYLNLLSLQQLEKVVLDSSRLVTEQMKLVEDGVRKGLFSKGEEELFRGEAGRLRAQLLDIRSEVAAAQETLAQQTLSQCALVADGAESSGEISPIEALIERARTSEIGLNHRIELANKLSQARHEMSEDDAFPAISPRLVYQHTNDGGDFLGVGIAIPLPLFNRNQGERARAAADEGAARVDRRSVEGELLAHRISLMRSAVVAKREGAEEYTRRVVPSFDSALRAQMQLYMSGKGNVMQVWQMLRELTAVKSEAVQRVVAAEIARAQLSVMVGEEL